MRFLAISGSLRAGSSNTRIVEALALLAPPGVEVAIYRGLNDLPHFNPDLEGDAPPAAVAELRRQIGLADGLIICSPEYAHGVVGVMKNALDWLVPSVEFPEKPVALINAAPRAVHAPAHIRETLSVMTARVVEAASVDAPLDGRRLTAAEIAADPVLGPLLAGALAAFRKAIE
jgi:NAD(P)H-dependent FMN reductase